MLSGSLSDDGAATEQCDLTGIILTKWRRYSDSDAMIFAETDGEPHNTITPIAKMRNSRYELNLVLRNNITTKEHLIGLYHPHEELHHIKEDNNGLIEIMGLAILPGRLKEEMAALMTTLLNGDNLYEVEELTKHADWTVEFMCLHPEFNAENAEAPSEMRSSWCLHWFWNMQVLKCNEEGSAALKRFLTEIQNG